MDIMTSVGLLCGVAVITVIMLLGGSLEMFWSEHAVIIIFGGSIAATMIRFPLSAILHGLPLGAKFAFTMSRLAARDLVDELARIAEIARKQGPVGLEKVETDREIFDAPRPPQALAVVRQLPECNRLIRDSNCIALNSGTSDALPRHAGYE